MAGSSSTAATPAHGLLQFVLGFVLIGVLTWFSDISDETGTVGVVFLVALWLLWSFSNSSRIQQFANLL